MEILTINNITALEYSAVIDLLSPVYTKEVPIIDIGTPINLLELEKLSTFFANQYAYMVELWGVMLHEVRLLKRIGLGKNLDAIAEAMDKRDLLDKVMSACKLKHHACSKLLLYHGSGKPQ